MLAVTQYELFTSKGLRLPFNFTQNAHASKPIQLSLPESLPVFIIIIVFFSSSLVINFHLFHEAFPRVHSYDSLVKVGCSETVLGFICR
jgi:hypothetical protein